MEQGMTAAAHAIVTLKQQQPVEQSTTSGAASPWQVFTSSNATFVAAPGVGTMPLDAAISVVLGLEVVQIQELKLDKIATKEQLSLFSTKEDLLQHAMLNLVTYSPEPDQPSDLDVGPELGYRYPR
jgi:hypothetical protein